MIVLKCLKCQHSEVTTSPACPCLPSQGSPHPAHGPGPHFSPPGPSVTAPVTLQQCWSPAPPQPCLCLAMGPAGLDPDHPWADFPAWPQPASSLWTHSVIMGLYLTPVTLTGPDPASCSQLNLRLASAPQQTWTGSAPGCPPPAHLLHWGWWDEPWLVRPCHAGPHGESPGLRLTLRPDMADRQLLRSGARLLLQMRSAMPRGGSCKVHLENVQLGLSTTFSTRRVVSTGAGCLQRSRIFMPGDFQNLTRP